MFEKKRDPITKLFHPDKMTVEEFIEIIADPRGHQAFIANMNNLNCIPKERHAEDWIQTYAAWMEMN